MTAFALLSLFVIALSPAIGSHLAVLIDRLPRGEDVVRAPSRCRNCAQRLGLRDLIPVLSFALNRGRCAHCGAAIPPWVLYVELMAIGAAVLAVIAAQGAAVNVVLGAVFLWLLIALAVSDALWMRLPDPLTAALALVTAAMALAPGGLGIQALWGALLGAGCFAALRWGYARLRGREGLGLGDVKLMVGLGAFCGPLVLPWLWLLAATTAVAVALVRARGRVSGHMALPFGTALCAAAACLWIVQV